MNFSFQFVRSTQIKYTKKVVFWGIFLVLCTAGSLELLGASPPGPPTGICPAHTGGLAVLPDNQLIQEMKYGHCISCFREDATFVHALTTDLAHHSKFLKNRPAMSQHVTCGPVFSTSEQGPLAGF